MQIFFGLNKHRNRVLEHEPLNALLIGFQGDFQPETGLLSFCSLPTR